MECPVCHHANVEPGSTNCPTCDSELKGFHELHGAEEERLKHKRTLRMLVIVVILLGLSWAASSLMLNEEENSIKSEESQFEQIIAERNKSISELQLENSKLAEENSALQEQVQSFEVIEYGEDGESIEKDYTVHVVKEGESLWSIAEEYHADGFKHEEIAGHNDLTDPHYIKVGDTVVIKH